jgi:hypothetical protein
VGTVAAELLDHGFAWLRGGFPSAAAAFAEASRMLEKCCATVGHPPVEVIGDFVLPPADGHESRDFQTLHFDFGLPLDPRVAQDVARYTALYIPGDRRKVGAVTRLVPLAALLHQRSWPSEHELLQRLAVYGTTHGAWRDEDGYTEGSLARIVEAAAGTPPELPSVKADPQFLCGMEFHDLPSELRFFVRHGLQIEAVEIDIALRPCDLLVFDNLALAHGRRRSRQPGELHQRVFGHRRLTVSGQCGLRDHVLSAFAPAEACGADQVAAVSIP